MKKYIILLLSVTNTMVFAQSRIVCKTAQDDDKALTIHVSGTIDGESIDFDHKLDLSVLEKSLRFAFKDKVLDSLNIYMTETPVKPKVPKVSRSTKPVIKEVDVEELVAERANDVSSLSKDYTEQPGYGKQSFNKEIIYSADCGVLFMRYKYVKDGEEYEYERTVNAKGKSEKERLRMIEETEKELGLSMIQ